MVDQAIREVAEIRKKTEQGQAQDKRNSWEDELHQKWNPSQHSNKEHSDEEDAEENEIQNTEPERATLENVGQPNGQPGGQPNGQPAGSTDSNLAQIPTGNSGNGPNPGKNIIKLLNYN